MPKFFRHPILIFVGLLLSCSHAPVFAPSAPTPNSSPVTPQKHAEVPAGLASTDYAVHSYVANRSGMVDSVSNLASEWGALILSRGGNAVDAAVAAAFSLAVARPDYAALGGGGFMLYCPAPDANARVPKDCVALDFRERAPRAVTPEQYKLKGQVDPEKTLWSGAASGVPGMVAGLTYAIEHYGKKNLKMILEHPIDLARNGVPFTSYMNFFAKKYWQKFNSETRKILSCKKKSESLPCDPGQRFVQSDLARTLKTISDQGAKGFYAGPVASAIVKGLQNAGGAMTLKDLEAYRVRLREPLHGQVFGRDVVTMPPPSAGGVGLLQMLSWAEMAQAEGAFSRGFGSADSTHALAHSMKLANADRPFWLGDPDFFEVPVKKLLSKEYLKSRFDSTYNTSKSTNLEGSGITNIQESPNTTHISVMDSEGNAVAMTITLNANFGSGLTIPGTGILMNNEIDDFTFDTETPNLWGLVGTQANFIEPGKRPLSSMSPTIVRDLKGNNQIALGASGGSKIPTAVFQVLANRLIFAMSLSDAVAAPRVHHQWKPDILNFEGYSMPIEVRERLMDLGYDLKATSFIAKVHAVERLENGVIEGMTDTRDEGASVGDKPKGAWHLLVVSDIL